MSIEEIPHRTAHFIRATLGTGIHLPSACYLYAAAALGALKGTGAKFQAGGAMLGSSVAVGWGISVDPANKRFSVHADHEVDDEGTYCGHCWIELAERDPYTFHPFVFDAMEGYRGPRHDSDTYVVYHAIPSLRSSVRNFHRDRIRTVMNAAAKDEDFQRAIWTAACLNPEQRGLLP
jgi:hypothetical protein